MESAAVFLDHGANMHARDEEFCTTPLGYASAAGQRRMVEFLLDRGAKVTLPDDPAWATPIALATYRGHGAIVRVLKAHDGSEIGRGKDHGDGRPPAFDSRASCDAGRFGHGGVVAGARHRRQHGHLFSRQRPAAARPARRGAAAPGHHLHGQGDPAGVQRRTGMELRDVGSVP